jgi:hypothetical protein
MPDEIVPRPGQRWVTTKRDHRGEVVTVEKTGPDYVSYRERGGRHGSSKRKRKLHKMRVAQFLATHRIKRANGRVRPVPAREGETMVIVTAGGNHAGAGPVPPLVEASPPARTGRGGSPKLDAAKAREIVDLLADGVPPGEIAETYDLTHNAVRNIGNGTSWAGATADLRERLGADIERHKWGRLSKAVAKARAASLETRRRRAETPREVVAGIAERAGAAIREHHRRYPEATLAPSSSAPGPVTGTRDPRLDEAAAALEELAEVVEITLRAAESRRGLPSYVDPAGLLLVVERAREAAARLGAR